MENKKEAVHTADAPAALGPYSQAIRTQGMLFLSGQIPLDPKTSQIVGQTTGEQAEQVLKNMAAVLKAQGLDFSHVVKTTVFLKNMEDFTQFNEVYGKHMTSPFPARSTVEVARLPKDVKIEIEAIAHYPNR